MNDLTTMLKIFAESKEDFTKRKIESTKDTVVEFPDRGVKIYFDKDGKFEFITKN